MLSDVNSQKNAYQFEDLKAIASCPTIPGYTPTSEAADRNELSDLLPSFQMHNYMFNRTLTESSLTDSVPPQYEESMCDSRSSTLLDESATNPSYIPSIDSSNLLLNNLDKLQKINLPFEAKIELTEEMPVLGSPCTRKNPLSQYLPGDMVYGHISFENKSKFKIPFEMLLVSMECEIGVLNPKGNTLIKKKILTTYDLEASFNFLGTDGDNDTCHILDPLDKKYLGFSERSLYPGVPIKKFFKFKIPNYILDDECNDQLFEHLKLPPSFGINRSSWNSKASFIHYEKHLGYGRIDKAGSPIIVNDYAGHGEFCSFFINAQIIGKRLEEYRPFYTPTTTHQYEFIFLKNVEHYFRVGKQPPVLGEYRVTNGSTKSQLDVFENLAKETLEVLHERELLREVDILDMRTQDEIIFSSCGKCKYASNADSEATDCKHQSLTSYRRDASFEYKKDFFNKRDGKLNVECKFDKSQHIRGFLPKLLDAHSQEKFYKEVNDETVAALLKIELEFKPSKASSVDPKLPTTINITPKMIAADIQSAFSIPFTIDDEFLLNDSKAIQQLFAKFALYYNKILEVMKINNYGVPKRTLQLLKGLGYCKYKEIPIPDIFKSQKVSISQNMWTYDQQQNVFRCAFDVPLQYDIKSIRDTPKCLTPSFQTCLLARLYKINFEVSPSRGKTSVVSFPITVV